MLVELVNVLRNGRTRHDRIKKLNREGIVHDHTLNPLVSSSLKTIESGSRAKYSC